MTKDSRKQPIPRSYQGDVQPETAYNNNNNNNNNHNNNNNNKK